MELWEPRLIYRYAGAPAKLTLLLSRGSGLPDRVELYAWKEAGLIALAGAEDGPYRVHHQGPWGGGSRELIWSTRLGEYLAGFFPHKGETCLKAWSDPASRAVIVGERRREDVVLDRRFRRVDMTMLFRAKLLETGELKLSCSLPLQVSAARSGELLELTADMDGPITCRPGHYTSYLTGEELPGLCWDWPSADGWGRACVGGWVVGPNIIDVVQADAARTFWAQSAEEPSGKPAARRLAALPGLYRSFTLGQKGKRAI